MARTYKDRLETAQIKRELVKTELETLQLERQKKYAEIIPNVRLSYDATSSDFDRQRRQVSIERTAEEGVLDSRHRLKAIARGRDLARNDSVAKTFLNQFCLNVVGVGPKAQAHTDSVEWNKQFNSWFNRSYAKNLDGRNDGLHLADFLNLTIATVKREGDFLLVFDDFDRDDGKLTAFEADQLVSINASKWEAFAVKNGYTEQDPTDKRKKIPLQQSNGLIYDRRGTTLFYIVTAVHGADSKNPEEVTIIPKTSARLIKKPFRFNQKRGVADILSIADDLQDLKELRKAELQSAKRASQEAVVVKSDDSIEQALARAGVDADDLITNSDNDETTLTLPKQKYEALDAYSGGAVQNIGLEDDVKLLSSERPNANIEPFTDFLRTQAGASMGLPQLFSSLIARKSYTACRAEILLAGLQFQVEQKWLERLMLDWVVRKAVNWAIRNGKMSTAPEYWADSISWGWRNPVISIDPYKEVKGLILKIKAGLTTFAKELGPNWEEHFEQLSKEIECLEELDLLKLNAIAETVAGASIDLMQDDPEEDEAEQKPANKN